MVEGSWEVARGARTWSLWLFGEGRNSKARAVSVCKTVVEVEVSAELMSQTRGMMLGGNIGGRPGQVYGRKSQAVV